MATIKTKWESTEKNPDEEHLRALWESEVKDFERSLAGEEDTSRLRQKNMAPLLKASQLSEADISGLLKAGAERSRTALRAAEAQVAKPPIDFNALHERDLALAKRHAEQIGPGNPSWQGFVFNPSYGGAWWEWNGEAEEVPNITFNVGANRFDPRTQSWGEGWFDGDFSRMHGYLAFRFTPPSWGHLHVHVYPWLHGYYSLYSNDEWYNSEYARAEVDTWVDAHQNFWRGRSYSRRFTLAGDELHPSRDGRIDGQYAHSYFTDVGEGDTVTVRVGARLYSYARASGGRSRLNFQAGNANYVYVPYVYWYLHH